jgi:hemerythrin-like metal-binding protein
MSAARHCSAKRVCDREDVVTAVNPIIGWSDDFALNLPEIDAQHQVLFGLIDELWKAIVARSGRDDQLRLIGDLEDYAVQHFKEEELFMQATGFPKLASHKLAHETYVRRITSERASIVSGSPSLSLDLLRFLQDWLVDHIMASDREYARNYESGKQPPAALGSFFNRLMRVGD